MKKYVISLMFLLILSVFSGCDYYDDVDDNDIDLSYEINEKGDFVNLSEDEILLREIALLRIACPCRIAPKAFLRKRRTNP